LVEEGDEDHTEKMVRAWHAAGKISDQELADSLAIPQ
jgi:hypothetical protein